MGTLTGKTIAVVGFSRAEMFDLSAVLEAGGAKWQAFAAPDGPSLARADLVIADVSVLPDLGNLATPLVMVGAMEPMAGPPLDPALRRDFSIAPPLRTDEIALRASHLLENSPTPKRQRAASTPVVLAADDDPTTIAIVRAVVTRNGMTFHSASNGREALELAASVDPSVIVLDVNMPFRDGFQVLTALRNDSRSADVPVVMLTSMQQEGDVVRGFSLGADDYVVKPFNPMELLARIRRLVRRQP